MSRKTEKIIALITAIIVALGGILLVCVAATAIAFVFGLLLIVIASFLFMSYNKPKFPSHDSSSVPSKPPPYGVTSGVTSDGIYWAEITDDMAKQHHD